jgi:inorganic pyrophosphatase
MTSIPFYPWRPHPWHGLDPDPAPPFAVYAYIEIAPYDSIQYEVDEAIGYPLFAPAQRTLAHAPSSVTLQPQR